MGVEYLANLAPALETGLRALANLALALETGLRVLVNLALALETGLRALANLALALEKGLRALANLALAPETGLGALVNLVLALETWLRALLNLAPEPVMASKRRTTLALLYDSDQGWQADPVLEVGTLWVLEPSVALEHDMTTTRQGVVPCLLPGNAARWLAKDPLGGVPVRGWHPPEVP